MMSRLFVVILAAAVLPLVAAPARADCTLKVHNCTSWSSNWRLEVESYDGDDGVHIIPADSISIKSGQTKNISCNHKNCDIYPASVSKYVAKAWQEYGDEYTGYPGKGNACKNIYYYDVDADGNGKVNERPDHLTEQFTLSSSEDMSCEELCGGRNCLD